MRKSLFCFLATISASTYAPATFAQDLDFKDTVLKILEDTVVSGEKVAIKDYEVICYSAVDKTTNQGEIKVITIDKDVPAMDIKLMEKLKLSPKFAAMIWNIVNASEGKPEIFDGSPTDFSTLDRTYVKNEVTEVLSIVLRLAKIDSRYPGYNLLAIDQETKAGGDKITSAYLIDSPNAENGKAIKLTCPVMTL